MSIETVMLIVSLSVAIHTVRHGAGKIAGVWSEAHWYERCGLALVFVPIPGPVDELVALWVLRRVLARRTSV